jgi:hypothetical protein
MATRSDSFYRWDSPVAVWSVQQAGAGDFPLWFEAGEKLNGTIASGLTLFWMQMILMNWVEVRRWMDMKNPGSVNQVRPLHPHPTLLP